MGELLPEGILAATVLFGAVADLLSTNRASAGKWPVLVVVAGLIATAFALLSHIPAGSAEVLFGLLVVDGRTQILKAGFVWVALISVLGVRRTRQLPQREKGQICLLILLSAVSGAVLSSAAHLVVFLIGSVGCMVTTVGMCAFGAAPKASSEVVEKALFRLMISTALLFLGCGLLYFISGALRVNEIRETVSVGQNPWVLWCIFGLLLAGIAQGAFFFPFHFLAGDLVEASSAPVGYYLAFSSALGGFAGLAFVGLGIFSTRANDHWVPLSSVHWTEILGQVSVVTMTLGNLLAFGQRKLKRLLGWIVLLTVSVAILPFSFPTAESVGFALHHLLVCCLAGAGVFFILDCSLDEDATAARDEVLTGLIWRRPLNGVLFVVFMLGLFGLPFTSGFGSRIQILGLQLGSGSYFLALALGLNWVFGFLHAVRLIALVIEKPKSSVAEGRSLAADTLVLALIFAPVAVASLRWDAISDRVVRALTQSF